MKMIKTTILLVACMATLAVVPNLLLVTSEIMEPSTAQAQAIQVSPPNAQRADGFNRAVLRAAREKGLSRGEMFKLRTGLVFSGQRLRALVAASCWENGLIGDDFDAEGRYRVEAIDWDKLIEALKELLPLILDFIEQLLILFGSADTGAELPRIIVSPVGSAAVVDDLPQRVAFTRADPIPVVWSSPAALTYPTYSHATTRAVCHGPNCPNATSAAAATRTRAVTRSRSTARRGIFRR